MFKGGGEGSGCACAFRWGGGQAVHVCFKGGGGEFSLARCDEAGGVSQVGWLDSGFT